MDAKAIIKKFGGIRPLARELNIAPAVVQNWSTRDSIPAKYFLPLIWLAEKDDISITLTDLAEMSIK
jgi:hypothetical protein